MSSIRSWWPHGFGHDKVKSENLQFSCSKLSDSAMTRPNRRFFDSARSISPIQSWRVRTRESSIWSGVPSDLAMTRPSRRVFYSAATISLIQLWQGRVWEFWVGHGDCPGLALTMLSRKVFDSAKGILSDSAMTMPWESLRFDHNNLSDLAATKSSQRVGLHPMVSDRYDAIRHANKRKKEE